MVRAEILTLLNELMGAYPHVNIKDPATTARMYEMALGEYEAKHIFKAASIHIRKSPYFPSPNNLIELLPNARLACELDEENAKNIEPPKYEALPAPVAPKKKISSFCKGSCICPYFEGDLCGGTKEEFEVCEL